MEIPVFDWFEEPIKDSVKSVFDGLNGKIESLDILKKYTNTHFEILKQQVSNVKILGMQQPVDLKVLYYPAAVSTDIRRRIYTPEWETIPDDLTTGSPRDSTMSRQSSSATAKIKRHQKKITTREQGDEYIAKNNRVVVLGGPGAGKTTFLKFLALAYSEKDVFKRTKLKNSLLPIYIHLPLLGRDATSILDFIASPLVERTDSHARLFYIRLLEIGECSIFMDSLDEVPLSQRKDVIQKILDFSQTYPKVNIVISCRTADYQQVLEGFNEIELARLSKEAVTSIVKAWFGKDTEKSNKLLSLLENDEAVASLTETPLLLSLLCIQFKNDLALPKRKTELYRRCVDALLRDWDTTRGFRRDTAYSQLSDDRKEKIFEALAGSACGEHIEYEFTEPFILEKISREISRFSIEEGEARGILGEMESHHGIVEKCSAETYEFSHGTMHEYFSAKYFVAKRMEMDVIRKRYEDESWHNIISFMASMIDDSTHMLNFLVEKSSMDKFQNYPAFGKRLAHLLLLYRCMSMGVNTPPERRTAVCAHLVTSQISMLRQINSDGVFPYAVRKINGVRQTLFTYKKPRQSLDRILKPYRSLMNEIVLSPIKEYTESVAREITKLTPISSENLFATIGTATCLLVPISDAKPELFLEKLLQYADDLLKSKAIPLKNVLVESINTHREMHPSLFADERPLVVR